MADRLQIIVLKNSTSFELQRLEEDLDHGEWWSDDRPTAVGDASWTNAPPSMIHAETTVAWGSEDSGAPTPLGSTTGTEGWVKFRIPEGGFLLIHWDVPFAGYGKSMAAVFHGDGTISTTTLCTRISHTNVHFGPGAPDVIDMNLDNLNPRPVDTYELTRVGSSGSALTTPEKVFDAVWRHSTSAEMQSYGLKFEDYQKEYDKLWEKDWRIYLLNTYVVNGKRHYDAVWRPGTSGEMQSYGLTFEDYHKEYDKLWEKNWRIYLLNTYVENGKRYYDAIWRPGTSGEMQSYGLTFDDYQKEYDKLWKEKWRIEILRNLHA